VPKKTESVLEAAIITLLRPLVRLMLKRGIAFGQFSELAKRAYVESAESEFRVPGRKLTISRVAVLTGLTRKEASRLMQGDDPSARDEPRRKVNRAARVVSAWVGDRKYQDGRERPASLPFENASAGKAQPSFSSLVAEHSGDMTPRAVLDELIRVGAVSKMKNGRFRLVQRSYIPQADEMAKLDILGTDVADLIAAVEHNLDSKNEAPYFQRKVAYDNLPADYLPRLQALLARKGQSLLEELNADMSRHDRDVKGKANDGDRHRAMIGIYYYEDDSDDS
jgi:hypothetical protein